MDCGEGRWWIVARGGGGRRHVGAERRREHNQQNLKPIASIIANNYVIYNSLSIIIFSKETPLEKQNFYN